MKTRDALRQVTGRHVEYGDGPLGRVAQQLLERFDAREDARLLDAEERAAQVGKGPILDVLRRELARAKGAALFDNSLPMVTCWDAHQAMERAKSANPTDHGIRTAAAHVKRLWQKDMMGNLAVGDVARLREHYIREYPKSRVAQIIDTEIPAVGFNTLPVQRLAQLAAQVTGRSEEQRQASYEAVVRSNGLEGKAPQVQRARALLRSLAEMNAETSAPSQHPADRTLARMAAYDDPILSRLGQFEDAAPSSTEDVGMEPAIDDIPMDEEILEVEEEFPHDEASEVIEEIESPNTGEPMVIELGPSLDDAEMFDDAEMGVETDLEAPGAPPMDDDVTPGFVASLRHFGQLEDFAEAPDEPFGEEEEAVLPLEEDESIGMLDEGPAEMQTVTMPDPTSDDGAMVEITITPAEEEESFEDEMLSEDGMDGFGEPAPVPEPESLDPNEGRLASQRQQPQRKRVHPETRQRVFLVHAVRNGVVTGAPLERVAAASMPAMLRRIAYKLREADGRRPIVRSVMSRQAFFSRFALVELDASQGNFLRITAEEAGSEFSPEIVSEGQPVVQHNVNVPEDGAEALMSDGKNSQNAPAELSRKEVVAICAQMGLSRKALQERVLAGDTIRVQDVSIRLTDNMDIEFRRGKRARVASLSDLKRVVSDFMAHAAAKVTMYRSGRVRERFRTQKRLAYTVRPIFSVGCAQCGGLDEYLMPAQPESVRCASCKYVTPAAAISIQLEARQAAAYPGYVVTTDIPGTLDQRRLNAKRLLREIGRVAQIKPDPVIDGGQLRFEIRNAGEAQINRIRLVLQDKFGVSDAQMAPVTARMDTVGPFGSPNQHAGASVPPPVVPQAQQPLPGAAIAPSPVPGAPQPLGIRAGEEHTADDGPGQQAEMPKPQMAPIQAQRLPVGPTLKHVQVREADGHTHWMPIEAATDQIARTMVASFMDGTEVLQVMDSLERHAQLEMGGAAPETDEPLPAGGADGANVAIPDVSGTGALNIEQGLVYDVPVEGVIDDGLKMAALVAFDHYKRNERLPIAEAIDRFLNTPPGKSMQRYGEDSSPARQLASAAVVAIAEAIYRRPDDIGYSEPSPGGFSPFGQRYRRAAADPAAFFQQARQQGTSIIDALDQALNQFRGADPNQLMQIAKQVYTAGEPEGPPVPVGSSYTPQEGWNIAGERRRAEDAKGPKPRKINQQQDDWVNLPGGGEVLGPDSETVDSTTNAVEADGSIKTQHHMQDNKGTSEAEGDLGPDSETRDPKRFDAPKPESKGHTFTESGGGWGTSYGDTGLGKDSDTGESQGGTTKEMASESSGAYSNIRSK